MNNPSIKLNSLYNFIGQLVPSLVGLLTVPILIQYIGTDRFGIITIVWMIIGYFGLFDMGLGRALTQLVAEKLGNSEHNGIPAIFWTSNILILLLASAGGILLFAITPTLVRDILKVGFAFQRETSISFYIISFGMPFVILGSLLTGYLSAFHRFDIINIVRVPMGIYSFAAPLIALPFTNSLIPIVSILVIGRFLSFSLYLYFCFRISPELRRGVVFDRLLISPLFKFGGWMTVSNVISPFMVYFDRIFISSIISMAVVAYYTTPFEFVTRLSIIPNAIIAVLFPAFASSYISNIVYTTDLFSRALKYMLLILFPIVLIIVTGAHQWMAIWLGNDFADNSYRVLQYLSIGVFINCLALVPCTFLQGIGRPEISAKFHVAELVVYIPILWWLVTHYGIIGAAIAWLLRMAIDAGLLLIAAQQVCKPNKLMPASLINMIITCLFLLLFLTTINDNWLKYSISFLFLILIELIVLFRLINVGERRDLFKILRLVQ